MRYTLLRVTPEGILLHRYHWCRLGLSSAHGASIDLVRSLRSAGEGVWAVWLDDTGAWRLARKAGSTLHDGVPWRYDVSPVAGLSGPLPKPAPPGPYAAVRRDDSVALLTAVDGTEIFEACRAAVIGWDGTRVVCVPADRPRVWSTAEAAIRDELGTTERVMVAGDDAPIMLVNAVRGTCTVAVPGRAAYPAGARSEIESVLRASAGWPER